MLPRHAESLARRHGDSGENLARKHDIHSAGKSGISVPQYGHGGDVYERRRGAAGNSAKVARRVGSQRRVEGTTSQERREINEPRFARYARVFEVSSFGASIVACGPRQTLMPR